MTNDNDVRRMPDNIPPFVKFCCANVPAVFDDSLSYYEALCALWKYLQDCIDVINNNALLEEEFIDKFNLLKEYVEHYFDNLDIQQEIDNKLDKMVYDGTFDQLIQPIFDTYKDQIDDEIAEIDQKVNRAVSTTPLVANSTAGMVDTSRIYVNTTDGKWYYYDGDSWEIGGTYQSTALGENSVRYINLETALQSGIEFSSIETGELSSNEHCYNGSIGSEIVLQSNSNFKCGHYDVAGGELLWVPFADTSANWGAMQYVLYYTDADDVVIDRIDITTVRGALATGGYKEILPATVKKVYFNSYVQGGRPPVMPYIVTGYNYLDTRLTSQLDGKIAIAASSTVSGIYSTRYWGEVIANYVTRIYPVNPLDKINLITTVANSDVLCAGVFVDANGNPIKYVAPIGTSEGPTSVNTDAIAPAGAVALYVTVSSSSVSSTVNKYIFTENAEPLSKKLTVTYNSGVLTMTNRFNGDYLKMQHFGGNNLFGFKGYKCGSKVVDTSTDMTPAPYIVKAVNNPDGDRTESGFTGGCHAFDNTIYPNSNATASEYSLHIYCDGTEISSGATTVCDKVTIVVENNIQATNTCLESGTGRSVLREKLEYIFDGYKLNVKNTITALEDVQLFRYYGLQLAGSNLGNYAVYSDDIYTSANVTNTPAKPYFITGDNIYMVMDKDGIGDYRYNDNAKAILSSNKAYYVPVYPQAGTYVPLSANKKLYFTGSYELKQTF